MKVELVTMEIKCTAVDCACIALRTLGEHRPYRFERPTFSTHQVVAATCYALKHDIFRRLNRGFNRTTNLPTRAPGCLATVTIVWVTEVRDLLHEDVTKQMDSEAAQE